MLDSIKLIIKGFVIGLGKVIPGLSGSILAMMLNVYEPALTALSSLKKNFYDNFKFLALLGTGIVIAIVLGSNILLFFLDKYYLQIIFLIGGIMLNGLFAILNKTKTSTFKERTIAFFVIAIFSLLSFLPSTNKGNVEATTNVFLYFISGIVDAFASIVPGISGTVLLMIVGTYYSVLNSYASILNLKLLGSNLLILLPFLHGVFFGVYFISKFINYMFNKYNNISYNCVAGFIIISMIMLFLKLDIFSFNILELLVSCLFFIIGFIFSKKVNI